MGAGREPGGVGVAACFRTARRGALAPEYCLTGWPVHAPRRRAALLFLFSTDFCGSPEPRGGFACSWSSGLSYCTNGTSRASSGSSSFAVRASRWTPSCRRWSAERFSSASTSPPSTSTGATTFCGYIGSAGARYSTEGRANTAGANRPTFFGRRSQARFGAYNTRTST